jgi:hypothetical protein
MPLKSTIRPIHFPSDSERRANVEQEISDRAF